MVEATLLALLLTSVYSTDTDEVEHLACIGSTLCEPAVSTCFLQRCACSPLPTDSCPTRYAHTYTMYNLFWYKYCCALIPSEFHSVQNVLQVDNFTPLIDGANTTRYRVTLWSKNNTGNTTWKNTGNQILTWSNADSYIPEYLSISDTYPAESVSELDVNDALSNISEAAGPLLEIKLDECYDAGLTYTMSFECTELFVTTCIVNNCSCWTSSSKFSPSPDRTGILLPEYCSVLDESSYIVMTSSTLSALHAASNSINEWQNGTFGGWAPEEDDIDPWMQFYNITENVNVSGVIIQGMAGDAIRTLSEFEVSNCTNNSETFNHDGGIFNSTTIHYITRFSSPFDCLKIRVLQPNDTNDTIQIGFRAGLINCNDTSYESAHDIACESALFLVETLNSTIADDSDDSQDGAQSVARTFRGVRDDFGKINKSDFAKTFDQKLGLPKIELLIKYKQIQDFIESDGLEFNTPSISALDATDDASGIAVKVPDQVFVNFSTESSVAVIVGQTLPPDNGGPNAMINGSKGRIVSPVITLMTLVDDNYTSLDNVSLEFDFEADNESDVMVGSFRELEIETNKEGPTDWDTDGCTTEFNRTTRRVAIQCNHTTSFAVILLIHKRTLPEWARILGEIITYVGCSLSAISLTAALVTYLLFRTKMDSYHFTIHFNLMAAILASLLVFIGLVERTEPELVCLITKYTLQYLFLSVFFWMLCEGIHLYRKVITVFETKTRQIFIFYLIGWGLPLTLVAITYGSLKLLHKPDKQEETNIYDDENPVCFLSYTDNSIWYFAVPVITIIAINTYILLRITIVVVRAAKIQTPASARKIHQAKTGIRSALLLMPLLGSSYVLGFAAAIDPIFELLFNALNSLQGFFIALFYCGMNSEIKTAVQQALQRGQDARSILASTTGKSGARFKNKIGPGETSEITLIDSEMMKKLREI